MGTDKVTAEYRKAQWTQVLRARRESGQTIKEFCEASGISRNAYFYWQKKLREAACTELMKQEEPPVRAWMQLTACPVKPATEGLAIEVNGCRIAVSRETDPELLKQVCRTLRFL